MKKAKNVLSLVLVGAVFVPLTLAAWCTPPKAFSISERRKLAQRPELTLEAVLDGSYMTNFQLFAQDQFPLRDTFRRLKAVTTYSILRQRENNGIYIQDGYAAKLDYPLDEASVTHATDRFSYIYERNLSGKNMNIYFSVVPDKNYFLAAENGYPAMDYTKLIQMMRAEMNYADYIDITSSLDISDYYKTDAHWRQEKLEDTAAVLMEGMGAGQSSGNVGKDALEAGNTSSSHPQEASSGGGYAAKYKLHALDRPFYGVYCAQSALPLPAETLYYLTNDVLDQCVVTNYETGSIGGIYDMNAAEGKDSYDIFLSGARPLMTIENPNAEGEKELIIFRDSFCSSIAPLLISDYRKMTLVDIRYLRADFLDRFIDFDGQDVLFLYSTGVLNHSETLT